MKFVLLMIAAVSTSIVVSGCAAPDIEGAKNQWKPTPEYLAKRAAEDIGVDESKVTVSNINIKQDRTLFEATTGKKQYICKVGSGFNAAYGSLLGGGQTDIADRVCHIKGE